MLVKIMRGLPGSGKSTLARALVEANDKGCSRSRTPNPDAVIVSADDYFMVLREAGENELVYKFDGAKLGQAHDSCKAKFTAALRGHVELVLVDNTNVVKRDYEWYVMEALKFGAEVEVITVSTTATAAELSKRNSHGVPESTILKMMGKWEP